MVKQIHLTLLPSFCSAFVTALKNGEGHENKGSVMLCALSSLLVTLRNLALELCTLCGCNLTCKL